MSWHVLISQWAINERIVLVFFYLLIVIAVCEFTFHNYCFNRTMSGVQITRLGHQRTHSKGHIKDFTVATPEEFVKRFGGDRVINKVTFYISVVFCFVFRSHSS
jgi:hypothetical protein